MGPLQAEPARAFYDVFLSYRHRDKSKVDELERQITKAGFACFRDTNFLSLADRANVTHGKVSEIRRHLSRSTCLILAYSRRARSRQNNSSHDGIGVWMPWELGFFDGALSSRIGVYLLDGPRGDADAAAYFKGSEYLQIYEELTKETLGDFLARHAVRERRIDNVGSAFVWIENLLRETVANPINVQLGVAEWFSDHAARFWQAIGQPAMAKGFLQVKGTLDDLRITTAARLRLPLLDELRTQPKPQTPQSTARRKSGLPTLSRAVTEPSGRLPTPRKPARRSPVRPG
jgi:hypothetical protein